MERKLEFHFIQNIQRKKDMAYISAAARHGFQEYSHAYCL